MFRVLWFTIQVVLVTAAAIWMFNRPGSINVHWLGYDVETQVGVAFVMLVVVFVTLSLFYRIVDFILSLPRRLAGLHGRKRREKGYLSLTQGLSAVAAGDARLATYHAYRMRRFLPAEKGLPWLLEAQAARLRGDEVEARAFFEKLQKDKNTAFMGVRGLLNSAIEGGDAARALELARQALTMHPGQAWIIRTVFGLEIERREWAAALLTLKKGERARAWSAEDIKGKRIAILLQQGEELVRGGYQGEAVRKLREAYRLNPGFVPAVLALAQLYADLHKRRAAVSVVERGWKENPHPDLARMWERLAPQNKPNDMGVRLRWFERLVALNPAHVESQLAAARAALEDGLWGEAWQYLSAAEKIEPSARLYRLWAQAEEKTGHAEAARRYWEKAAHSASSRVWTCVESGRLYDRWSPLAEPHGAFNTIQWGFPHIQPSGALSHGVTAISGAHDTVLEPVQGVISRH